MSESSLSTQKPIALFYGSSTCYTEMASEKIANCLESLCGQPVVDIFNITDTPIATALLYDKVLMGIPTWDYGELQEDWEEIWDDISDLDFSHIQVALFGLGDQVGYPEWFLDALGYLNAHLLRQNATMRGYTPIEGFTFEGSKALTPDGQQFVGLALDEENEFDLTEARIKRWCQQILEEFDQ